MTFTPSGKLNIANGKPPVLIGDTSSTGRFPMAMLVYRGVCPASCTLPSPLASSGFHPGDILRKL